MKKRSIKNQERINSKRLRRIEKYERVFSAHKYAGKGEKNIETLIGKSVVAIAAPHAVNFFENGVQQMADAYSGSLVRLLADEVGCHAIYVKKQYTKQQMDSIISEICNFVYEQKIKVLIDFQVANIENNAIIEISSYDNEQETEKYSVVRTAIQYSFEYEYRDLLLKNIVSMNSKNNTSIISTAAKEANISYVHVGINKAYIGLIMKDTFIRLYNILLKTLSMLVNLDWNADKIQVYRLWQSTRHKPQDKIEIAELVGNVFKKNSLLNICTYGLELEKARLHTPSKKTISDLSVGSNIGEYIFLTNRLIELLFGREWIEGKEQEAGLKGAPIIVYENKKEVYPIGMPKANQLDGVFFSSALYQEKLEEFSLFDYVIFNRYTDSRFYIDFEKANYEDFGRVKDENGLMAKKVMIPRYYKKLLGYLDYPLKMIRCEEFEGILDKLETEDEKNALKECYELIEGEIFYKLKKVYDFGIDETGGDLGLTENQIKSRETVISVQNRMELFNNVEILKVPKKDKFKRPIYIRVLHTLDKFRIWILLKTIGKSEYLLKTEWTSETDDRNNITRLSPNMMSLLGVSENDKIIVKFGRKQEVLRVLANEELTDYQIGLPAPARKNLGMNSINDIVIVHRDMMHIFLRHSEAQTIAILGTVLAVFQVITQFWIGFIVCLITIPLIMYFVLNEERVKVK